MSKKRKSVMYMADFETTVYDGQTDTEVWAAALVKIGTEAVVIYHSIGDFLHAVEALSVCDKTDIIIYFHNLKFDGTFICRICSRRGFIVRLSSRTDTVTIALARISSYQMVTLNIWCQIWGSGTR